MVPKGWKDATLGKLVQLQRGHDLPATERVEGKIPVIGGGGPNGFHNVARASAPGVVIGRSGSGIGNAWWSDEPFWPLNTGLYVTDFLGNDPKFCFHWLDWIDFRSYNSGGAQPSLNRNFISPIPIPIPPLAEQQKIAEILSTWDRAIKTTERLIAKATAQKQALMQQLLTGKRRLKDFEGREWKQTSLGDVVTSIRGGGTPDKSRDDFWGGDIPWVSVKDLKSDLLTTTQDHITDAGLASSAANFFKAGTVIVATRMAVGATAILGRDMAINQDIKAILPSANLSNRYLFHFMKMVSRQLEALGTGSTVKGIVLDDLRRVHIGLPCTLEEQERIADVLDTSAVEAEKLKRSIDQLHQMKTALLQQLLTGKRRVKV